MLLWTHKEREEKGPIWYVRDSLRLQTVLRSVYEQENIRSNEQPSHSRLKTSVTRHVDQMVRTRNFRARNERIGTGVVTKSQKETISVERKVRECSQLKSEKIRCSRGDSCSFSHGSIRGQRKEYSRALLLQMRSHRLTEENPRKVLVPEEKALLEEKAECRAKISSNESVRTRRVIIGTLPYVEIRHF